MKGGSLRRHEGYLLIDHRESPGLTDEGTRVAQLPPGAGRGMFEAPTYTCSHCQRVVVVNPLRTRAREWCAKCDRIICDQCSKVMAATGVCESFERFADSYLNAASKGAPLPTPIGGS